MNGFVLPGRWGLLVMSLSLLLSACGPQAGGYPFHELDIPEQRVFNGFAFLKKERLADAQREFEQALLLQPGCSAAHRGIGLVYGMKKDFSRAFDAMYLAGVHAGDGLERALAEVGMMSLHRMETRKGWLELAERHFDRALAFSGDLPEAYLELGLAYKQAHRYPEAEAAFRKILDLNKTLLNDARGELVILEKIQEARPRSAVGRDVVLVRRINRAETAALLAREFPVEQIADRAGVHRAEPLPAAPPDVVNHPMKKEILLVLHLGIQGLRLLPGGPFAPDQFLTRAGFATVVADLLVRGSANPELREKYDRAYSPFHDVRRTSPYFQSIMICYDWGGVMKGWEGYFHPMETVSGVDALLILRGAENKVKGK